MNIVLAGMPSSGKTTVARELENSGRTVYDTDAEIERRHGAVAEIFKNHGEEYFRKLESEEVKRLSKLDGIVIATGGGCLLRRENIDLLKSNGKIVYLRTDLKTLLERLNGDTSRPLLKGDTENKLKRLYEERTPVYERAADIIIDTDGLTPAQIAQRISGLIK